jgi:hypothetical protein
MLEVIDNATAANLDDVTRFIRGVVTITYVPTQHQISISSPSMFWGTFSRE